jgi:transcription termination factor Rho
MLDILPPAMAEKLEELHLADLHALASELGVPRYRMLRRAELAREIEARRDSGEPEPELEPESQPEPEDQPEPEPRIEPEGKAKPEPEGEPEESPVGRERERLEAAATEDVTGVLDITPQRYGFLRLNRLETNPDDVYVSASQVRRCELRSGDEVSGPARAPRRGERHRALVHVDRVSGGEPLLDRPEFEKLTPILPKRRLALDLRPSDVLTRAADLLVPLAYGQRVLVKSGPRSGRTTLLRGLAAAVGAVEGPELIVLLIDERPEEATAWREALPDAQVATATAELAPAEQVRVARLALEWARRRAEAGADVVLIVDSLSRLAVAAGEAAEVKRLFGSGRDLAEEGAGSLTVIATVVEGAEDDGVAERAVITTESSLIRLDPELAAAGVFPALRAGDCRVSNEDELREPEELAAVRRLRSLLADLGPAEAATLLRERIESSRTNAELLAGI